MWRRCGVISGSAQVLFLCGVDTSHLMIPSRYVSPSSTRGLEEREFRKMSSVSWSIRPLRQYPLAHFPDAKVGICHLLYNSMSPLTQGCCVGLIFSGLSGLSESFICQKRRSNHVKHTYLADRNRHSIPSRFLSALSLRHKIGWCTPNHRPHRLNANACRNTVSLPHHHCTCTSHG